MEKSLKDMINDEVLKRCKPKVNKQENKQEPSNKKNSPHLAVTHKEQGGAASGRNTPLLMKSMAPDDFEAFCNGITNIDILSVLYTSLLESDSDTLQNIINKGKQ